MWQITNKFAYHKSWSKYDGFGSCWVDGDVLVFWHFDGL